MRNQLGALAPVRAATGTVCALLATVVSIPAAHAEWIPTNFGIGADAEVRESNPTQNRGASTEIATRVRNDFIAGDPSDGTDRNSAIYTKFDLSGVSQAGPYTTAFRMTYRNNNLSGPRIQDTITPNPAIRTGLAIYGLNPAANGANWSEDTITYLNAPGMTFDGDVGTTDFNSDLTFLGTVSFPEIGNQNNLPVGQQLVFTSALLDQFVNDAIDGGAMHVTLVSARIHGGDSPFSNWVNFNYLFNPKEQTTLNNDPNYDFDITDPNNPLGSPYSGADNSTGQFSPSLLIVPEPATGVMTLLALTALVSRRRR